MTELDTSKFSFYVITLAFYFLIVGSILYYMLVEPELMVIHIYSIITATIIMIIAMVGIIYGDFDW